MLGKLPVGVGQALQGWRAGLDKTVIGRLSATSVVPMRIQSWAFNADCWLPVKYTADGSGISPPLEWGAAPAKASSVAIIVEDADSPTFLPLVHAIVVNLDPSGCRLPEGSLNSRARAGVGADVGRNSYLSRAWLPPDPPPGHGAHRYLFQVFALAGAPILGAPGRRGFVRAISEQCIAAGCLVGQYGRSESRMAASPRGT